MTMTKQQYKEKIEEIEASTSKIVDTLLEITEHLDDLKLKYPEEILINMTYTNIRVCQLRFQKILQRLNEEDNGTNAV